MRKLLFAVVTAIFALSVEATVIDASLIQTSGDPAVGTGRFYGYRTTTDGPGDDAFTKVKDFAESNHVPLVVIWSNEDCEHCDAFAADCNRRISDVQEWLKETRALVVYFKSDSGDDPPARNEAPKASSDAYYFAYDSCGARPAWPLIGIYYKPDDGEALTWGTPYGQDTNSKNFSYLKTKVKAFFDKHGLDDCSGDFTVIPEGLHRYEADAENDRVEIDLRREQMTYFVVTNRITARWPDDDEPAFTTNLIWASGQSEMKVPVPVRPDAETPFAVGEIILSLYDEDDVLRGSNVIACVETENGASNPKWLGESFGFGEWTMDLDGAMALAEAENGYTLVSMQGALWCPDCANVERNFLELETNGVNIVKQWARDHKVALVSIDIPNFNGPSVKDFASPTLLSRDPYASTLVRVKELPMSGGDPSLTNKILRSGLGYLTRKGIDNDAAFAVLDRNHWLAVKNTDNGGFHRPEDGNVNRTGVPIFVLLDSRGRVVSRLTRMASVSPMKFDKGGNEIAEANALSALKRFDEMLAMATPGNAHYDKTEIDNGYAGSDAVVIAANGGTVSSELCHADFQDVFRLNGAGSGMRQNISVSGTTTAPIKLSFAIVDPSDGKMKELLFTKGTLSAGMSLSMMLDSGSEYYAVVSGADITSASFDVFNPLTDNFHPYVLRSAVVFVPTESQSSGNAPVGSSEVVMHIESGTLYRVTGIVGGVAGKLVAQGGDVYRALVTEDLRLTTTSQGGTVAFQIWRPGAIGFETSVERVFEYAPTGIVTVVRRDGGSGAASVRVCWVGEDTGLSSRYAWTDQTVSWADGESGPREVGFRPIANEQHEGEGSFYLALSPVGECPAEVSSETNTVTIYDTDTPCLEKTEYTVDTYGNFSSSVPMKVLNLREGGRVTLSVTRGLPSGMKLAYDAATGSVVLSGVPSKAGVYEVEITVSERRRSGKSTGESSKLIIKVGDAAEYNKYTAAKRPAQKLALTVETNGFDRVVGFLDLSITAKGRISARYTGTESKTISFSGNWNGFEGDGMTVETTLTTKGAELHLEMDADGTVYAELTLPDGYSRYLSEDGFSAVADWPEDADWSSFKGYYTVELPVTNSTGSVAAPTGAGFLTLTLTSAANVKSGTVRYAGVLSDGTSISGSATLRNLVALGDGFAELPVFNRVGQNVFGASMSVSGNGSERWDDMLDANRHMVVLPAEDVQAYVLHSQEGFEYDLQLDVHGSYYVQGVSPLALRNLFYDKFSSDIPYVLDFDYESCVESERYGAVSSMPESFVWPLANRMTMERTSGRSFSFATRTGVMSGSARMTFEHGWTINGTYRAVAVPGWVDAESCCGAVTYLGPVLPFARGTFYFRDMVGGRSVMRSIPVRLDICR